MYEGNLVYFTEKDMVQFLAYGNTVVRNSQGPNGSVGELKGNRCHIELGAIITS